MILEFGFDVLIKRFGKEHSRAAPTISANSFYTTPKTVPVKMLKRLDTNRISIVEANLRVGIWESNHLGRVSIRVAKAQS